MTKIYLIRHAEAEGNLYRRVQGHYDGQITPLGRVQIDALAERFRGERIDALYSSDLSRTIATAGAIARYHDLPIYTTPALREVGMGVWENQAWGDITYAHPAEYQAFSNDPDRWQIEGCEPFPAVTRRMVSAVSALAKRHEGQTIALVSHGMAIRSLLSAVLGVPSREIASLPHGDNTAVSLLHGERGVLTVEYCNDNSHLDPGSSTFARQSWWRSRTGTDFNNLRFAPLDPAADRDFYLACYRDAWVFSHGNDRDFMPELYWQSALRHARSDPRAVMKAFHDREAAALVDLDMERAAQDDAGWISLCYVHPEFRSRRMAVQLIGHAAAVFQSLGRKALRLHVSENNAHARTVYAHYGFRAIGRDAGVSSAMILMEKSLVPDAPVPGRVLPLEAAL